MNPEKYRKYTDELTHRLERDDAVLGLVALGSMAEVGALPDQWSDHDFFVIVNTPDRERFKADLSWLPLHDEIVFHFRETEHGLKVFYRNGHLIEFAVFDPDELFLARVNRYRTLFDRADIGERMKKIKDDSTGKAAGSIPGDRWLLGMFLGNIWVGVGRYRRGERLSSHCFVKDFALKHLVTLIEKHIPSNNANCLDNLDPMRRFELAYPEIGKELDDILKMEVPQAAKELMKLAVKNLASRMDGFPTEAFYREWES